MHVLYFHFDWLIVKIHDSFHCKQDILIVNMKGSLHCKQGNCRKPHFTTSCSI